MGPHEHVTSTTLHRKACACATYILSWSPLDHPADIFPDDKHKVDWGLKINSKELSSSAPKDTLSLIAISYDEIMLYTNHY